MIKNWKSYRQVESKDCGPACLKMILKHYGKNVALPTIRAYSETTRNGSNLTGISDAAEKLGLRTLGISINFEKFIKEAPLPNIVHWEGNHFVVVYKIKNNKIFVADPAQGLIKYEPKEFVNKWIGENLADTTIRGVVLLLEPTISFKQQDENENEKNSGFKFLGIYFIRYKRFFYQLFFGLIATSLLQVLVPFLTQSIVDVGIKNQDINFIYLILAAQLFVFIGKSSVEIIGGWILLHLSTRINVSLISDFFLKLMKLPISYFDTRLTGDILQRINDHHRIEQLLTSTSLSTLFSMVNLLIFGVILAWYNLTIFLIFLIGFCLYFFWIFIFLKRRKKLDYQRFSQISVEQSKVIEIISGMQEIKLNNAEQQKRWGWEYLQAKLFQLEVKSLQLDQAQSIGSNFINELKNVIITVCAATLVIHGQLTLGMLLAISYITGQLNGPILQLVGFTHSLQDARISLDRLSEIHNKDDEEIEDQPKISELNTNQDLIFNNVSFRYLSSPEFVLKNISCIIPAKKVTAIVGSSGSGKTTLLKLLLKFYVPTEGNVLIGSTNLINVSHKFWRSLFGAVMQEGFIFNDTIAKNIAVGKDEIDYLRLFEAIKVANIQEFVESLPQNYNTKIGSEGIGMSTGQKQRLIIARAVYKNPDFLFFDEATSALDANNEKIIMQNLNQFYKGKTCIIIAHRLSTVKNADQILVMNDGKIIETGTHKTLIAQNANYFELVKNQLQLENLASITIETNNA
ncbi:peptidase domain-containing ABC transporter [Pedobacter sp. SD-b]|uniref:Peptidase domain-containing ABC transporter n=1 Tax=Pedobacter segetis TaxID=2793069 RepID=A0ABS1BJE8_9SPHI|nr:peptidase domain-containing ABC transporter [Pedobacter segetis]MBK0382466.1 peptidase domain-containing ABC transporter [Pedobacter segetis]